MCSSGLRPKVWYGKTGLEVGAEVPHPAYGKHDVHAKLEGTVSGGDSGRGMMEYTLKTSRLGPADLWVASLGGRP